MALPTQQRLFHKYYTLLAKSLAAADSPSVAIAGRGRVVDIRVDVLISHADDPGGPDRPLSLPDRSLMG